MIYLTRLDKALELRPELTERDIKTKICPRDIFGAGFPSAMGCNYDGGNPEVCEKCWNEPYKDITKEKNYERF